MMHPGVVLDDNDNDNDDLLLLFFFELRLWGGQRVRPEGGVWV
jgi:hypothetical protein